MPTEQPKPSFPILTRLDKILSDAITHHFMTDEEARVLKNLVEFEEKWIPSSLYDAYQGLTQPLE